MAGRNTDEIRKLRDEASDFMAAAKPAKAVRHYLRLCDLESENGDWPRRAADCYRLLGKKPQQLELLLRAARTYSSASQFLKGIAMCKLALALAPNDPQIKAELSRLHEQHSPPRPLPRPAAITPSPPPPRHEAHKSPTTSLTDGSAEDAPSAVVPARRPSLPPPIIEHTRARAAERRSLEASLPSPPPLEAIDLRARLSLSEAEDQPPSRLPRESLGVEAIDVDDLMIEELVPESEHLDIDHLGSPEAPPPESPAAEALGRTPLFSDIDPSLFGKLIERVELMELSAKQVLFEQGEAADAMYVIIDGSVSAIARADLDSPPLRIATLNAGDFFGEIGLLGDQPRQASIVATAPTQLLRIDRSTISELLELSPRFLRTLLRFLRERLVESIMLTSPMFTPFGPEDQATLKRLFRFVEIEDKTVVVRQGEKADGLYVLLTGEAVVTVNSDVPLKQLGPGDIFGEMSLLQNQPAMASVTLRSKAFALKLPDRYFMQVMMTHPVMMEYVATLGAERGVENAQRLSTDDAPAQPSLVLDSDEGHVALF